MRELREARKAKADEQARNSSVRRCDDGSVDVLGYLLAARPAIREADQTIITQAIEAINQTLNRQEEQETEMTDLDSKLNEALEAQSHLTKVIEQLKSEKAQRDEKAKADAQAMRMGRMIQLTKSYRHLTPYPYMHIIAKQVRGEQKIKLNLAETKQQEDFGSSSSSVQMDMPSFDTIEALLIALDKADKKRAEAEDRLARFGKAYGFSV